MKKLALFLGVLLSVSTVFAEVRVVIDGQNYSCSPGGSSGENNCECSADQEKFGNRFWYPIVTKRGHSLSSPYSVSFATEAEAIRECQRRIIKNPDCYN